MIELLSNKAINKKERKKEVVVFPILQEQNGNSQVNMSTLSGSTKGRRGQSREILAVVVYDCN